MLHFEGENMKERGRVEIRVSVAFGGVSVYENEHTQQVAWFECPYCGHKSRIGNMSIRAEGRKTILKCLSCHDEYIKPYMPSNDEVEKENIT